MGTNRLVPNRCTRMCGTESGDQWLGSNKEACISHFGDYQSRRCDSVRRLSWPPVEEHHSVASMLHSAEILYALPRAEFPVSSCCVPYEATWQWLLVAAHSDWLERLPLSPDTRARDAALAEAARTARVQAFMMNLFDGGDETAGPSDQMRVVELVHKGIQEANALNSAPKIQAEMYQTLGNIDDKLGHLDEANPLKRNG